MARPASEAIIGGEVDCHRRIPCLRLDVADRGQLAQGRRIADENIETAELLMQRAAELVDRGAVGEVHRH